MDKQGYFYIQDEPLVPADILPLLQSLGADVSMVWVSPGPRRSPHYGLGTTWAELVQTVCQALVQAGIPASPMTREEYFENLPRRNPNTSRSAPREGNQVVYIQRAENTETANGHHNIQPDQIMCRPETTQSLQQGSLQTCQHTNPQHGRSEQAAMDQSGQYSRGFRDNSTQEALDYLGKLMESNHRKDRANGTDQPSQNTPQNNIRQTNQHVSLHSDQQGMDQFVSLHSAQQGMDQHVSLHDAQQALNQFVSLHSAQQGMDQHFSLHSAQQGMDQHVSFHSAQEGMDQHVSFHSAQEGMDQHVSFHSAQEGMDQHVSLHSAQQGMDQPGEIQHDTQSFSFLAPPHQPSHQPSHQQLTDLWSLLPPVDAVPNPGQ